MNINKNYIKYYILLGGISCNFQYFIYCFLLVMGFCHSIFYKHKHAQHTPNYTPNTRPLHAHYKHFVFHVYLNGLNKKGYFRGTLYICTPNNHNT